VPSQIRAKLANALGVLHEQIFVQDPPSPKKFFWAPYLRGKMAECGKTSADLAREIGGDVGRIRNWMEMDDGKILWRDDKDNQVLSGMISPETQQLLADALGCAPVDLFGSERPKDGLRWVVRPSFSIAVEAFVDERVGFLREADVDAERLGRWLNWQEPVQSGTWRRINILLGLPEGSQQLFDPDQKTVDAHG
jgi:hypothetical protein